MSNPQGLEQLTPDEIRIADFWKINWVDGSEPVVAKISNHADFITGDPDLKMLDIRPTQFPRDRYTTAVHKIASIEPVKYSIENGGETYVAADEREIELHNARMLKKFLQPYRQIGHRFDLTPMVDRITFATRMAVNVFYTGEHVIVAMQTPKLYNKFVGSDDDNGKTHFVVATLNNHCSHSTIESAIVESLTNEGHNGFSRAVNDLVAAARKRNEGQK